MAKIRQYDPNTGAYSNEPPPDGKLERFTKASTRSISPLWFPADYPREMREKEVLKGVWRVVQDEGLLCMRVEGGGILVHGVENSAHFAASRARGWPDILVVLPPNGRICGLEVKKVGGVISITQLGVLARMIQVGGLGCVVCSSEGCRKALLGAAPITTIKYPGLPPVPVY